MKRIYVISLLYGLCLMISCKAITGEIEESGSKKTFPTYTPKPTATPRPDGIVDAEVKVYEEPWGIYWIVWEGMSQEIITTLLPGDEVKILGQLGEKFWLYIETEDGLTGWIRNDFLYDPCIYLNWQGSSNEMPFFMPSEGCGIEAGRWVFINKDYQDIPKLPYRLPSGALNPLGSEENNSLLITNSTDKDVIVILQEIETSTGDDDSNEPGPYINTSPYSSYHFPNNYLYVRSKEQASIGNIYGGTYRLFVETGSDWYPDFGDFGNGFAHFQYNEFITFPTYSEVIRRMIDSGLIGGSQGKKYQDPKKIQIALVALNNELADFKKIESEDFPTVNIPHPYHRPEDFLMDTVDTQPDKQIAGNYFACIDESEYELPPYIDILNAEIIIEDGMLEAEIVFTGLPDTLNFNRPGTGNNYLEYQWFVDIDIDNDVSTGFQGYDYRVSVSYFADNDQKYEGTLNAVIFPAALYESDISGGENYISDMNSFFENNSLFISTVNQLPISELPRIRVGAYDKNPSGQPYEDIVLCELR